MKTLYTHDEALTIVKNNHNYRLWINPIESDYDMLQRFNGRIWRNSVYVCKENMKCECIGL